MKEAAHITFDDRGLLSVDCDATDQRSFARPQCAALAIEQHCGMRDDQTGDGVFAAAASDDEPHFLDRPLGRITAGDAAEEINLSSAHRQGVGGLENCPPAVP
ncbi:hypothetical protein [Methylocystis sp. H62]|uniref:hypothetical protein n=1 Tax=Methylocystis sp. H62 TaxID=2785789 RepID=UPI0039174338